MADDDESQVVEEAGNSEGSTGEGGSSSRLWIIVSAVVVLIGAGAGYGTARLLQGAAAAAPQTEENPAPEARQQPQADGKEEELAYHDFETITVNLNEARLARYIRATVTLAVKAKKYGEAQKAIERKQPQLRSWLTVYLSGCTLEDVRGPKNLNRIRREIQDSFNKHLWPDGEPLIEAVFLKEFAVQ